METKYTPGPWRMLAGHIYTNHEGGDDFVVLVRLTSANRALVESAPDMVEALTWALDQIEDDLCPDHQAALEHARAVLARAQGVQL
jgi:hypothetical protein